MRQRVWLNIIDLLYRSINNRESCSLPSKCLWYVPCSQVPSIPPLCSVWMCLNAIVFWCPVTGRSVSFHFWPLRAFTCLLCVLVALRVNNEALDVKFFVVASLFVSKIPRVQKASTRSALSSDSTLFQSVQRVQESAKEARRSARTNQRLMFRCREDSDKKIRLFQHSFPEFWEVGFN